MNTKHENLKEQVAEKLARIAKQMDAGSMEEWHKLVERLRGTQLYEQAIRDVIATHPECKEAAEKLLMSQRRGEAAT